MSIIHHRCFFFKLEPFYSDTIRRITFQISDIQASILSNPSTSTFLCVPNLQGENLSLSEFTQNCVTIQPTLNQQCQSIDAAYRNHSILLGCSFGGLAAWKFAINPPSTLQHLILIDVLPNLMLFPKWKRLALNLIPWFPPMLTQGIYTNIRRVQRQNPTVDIQQVVRRIQSFEEDFPPNIFPVSTLVLSRNPTFHQAWVQLAHSHTNLTTWVLSDVEQQISDWINLRP